MSSFNYTIHVIGAGHLGAALIQGLLSSGILPNQIFITEHHPKRCQLITQELGVANYSNEPIDITLLCIKPQQLSKLVLIDSYSTKVMISTLAGTEINHLNQHLKKWPIVRAMPNLAAFYQASMTALYTNDQSDTIRSMVNMLFQRIGQLIWLEKESHMHLATAIVGSGPAFFLDLFSHIIHIDKKSPIEVMLYGAVESTIALAKNSNGDIQSIIKAITSPGGTTEAGLKMMQENKSAKNLAEVFEVTIKKSKGLQGKNTVLS
jgi:pyrroline-5-carboxylate reductase